VKGSLSVLMMTAALMESQGLRFHNFEAASRKPKPGEKTAADFAAIARAKERRKRKAERKERERQRQPNRLAEQRGSNDGGTTP